ncbi:hypothetical protein B0H67DRAFT_229033 [Lasiosphaeris hirsuta]|uniref:Uncharacterized protein n=1 Tax=Lasiosphaeris hirsuta TaxID=260670 RepID=A0AA40AFL3_9PEZI|nr:hypothetical protein B0H67DRAFT_229033 [Lasiosphaeris hirsuta]
MIQYRILALETASHVTSVVATRRVSGVVSFPSSDLRVARYAGGSNNFQVHHCATAEYQLIDGGATVYHAPVVVCINNKQCCCPFIPTQATTSDGNPRHLQGAISSQACVAEQTTPGHCATGYYTTSGRCCPSGYAPWSTLLGGQTSCFSPIDTTVTPPPLPSDADTI